MVGLDPGREELRRAVAQRTRRMLDEGLVEEVRGLLARGLGPEARPLQAIGYRQALAVVRGELRVEEAEQANVASTLRFAKRQRTWFRHQVEARWFPGESEAFSAVLAWLDEVPAPGNPR